MADHHLRQLYHIYDWCEYFQFLHRIQWVSITWPVCVCVCVCVRATFIDRTSTTLLSFVFRLSLSMNITDKIIFLSFSSPTQKTVAEFLRHSLSPSQDILFIIYLFGTVNTARKSREHSSAPKWTKGATKKPLISAQKKKSKN